MPDRNEFHDANRRRWEAGAEQWGRGADNRGLWPRCPTEPELVLCPLELRYLRAVEGKQVCVLGSGDNQVVFALAGLGFKVTSVDISQGQLDIAAGRADELGLEITFIRSDVTDLAVLQDGAFDIVYTGGHVAVWVSDLPAYYQEAGRILKKGGLFIVNEYHPFRRIWQEDKATFELHVPYLNRGPHEYDESEDILRKTPGELKTYEFHWTIADYVNAIMGAGCRLVEMDEYGEAVADWEPVPQEGLPEFLLMIARKE